MPLRSWTDHIGIGVFSFPYVNWLDCYAILYILIFVNVLYVEILSVYQKYQISILIVLAARDSLSNDYRHCNLW